MGNRSLLPRSLVMGSALLVSIIVVGTIGFMIEGHDPIESLYATISAVTTEGYTPDRPITATEKLFVIALVVAGVGAGLYVFGSFTEFLVEGGLRGTWQERKRRVAVQQLSAHFIISGFGRVGQRAATELEEAHCAFVVVDHNPATIRVAHERGLLYHQGDATSDDVLKVVGIHRARGLLACADSDVNNVYVTLSARSLNPDLYVVARASEASAEHKLFKAGADRVISPYSIAGNRMAHLAVQPLAADYVDVFVNGQQLGVQIEERGITAASPLSGRTVGDIRAHELEGGHILAVQHEGTFITFVHDDLVLQPEDRVLIAGTTAQLAHFDQAVH